MSKSLFSQGLTLLLGLLFSASLQAVEEEIDWLEPGDAFPSLEAKDQHEKDFPMPEDVRFVFVTFDMGTGKRANRFFSEKGADWLPENYAVFLSNIYGMPGIARTFAMPKMRRYPHRIMLADEQGLLDHYPAEKGKVTVFELNGAGEIAGIAFWDPRDGEPPLLKE